MTILTALSLNLKEGSTSPNLFCVNLPFMTPEEFKRLQPSLPTQPGIYKYADENGKFLYIGKAKNLKNRISSYFTKSKFQSARLKVLAKKTTHIEFTIVDSEVDVLLLENSLIKEHQPKYNIQLRDDKSFPFICIKNERFPRVFLTRNIVNDRSGYLGPFTSVTRSKALLNLITAIYPLRTCNFNLSEKNVENGKFKICLEFHMGNCLGPCENLQSENDYTHSIENIRHILKGNVSAVIVELKEEMRAKAKAFEYEKAGELKRKIELLKNYKSKSTIVNARIADVGVFGIDQDEKLGYVSYLRVANGAIIQSKVMEFFKGLDESLAEILEFAIHEIYGRSDSFPEEIIVPFMVATFEERVALVVPRIGDKKKLLDLATKNATFKKNQKLNQAAKSPGRVGRKLEALRADFRLKDLPRHIECFDNSNIQGSDPVASLVVFKNTRPAKKEYRHFNIKTVEGPDDFGSMREIVLRRYKRLLDEQNPLPQLIVIDGGKGQLSAAVESLEKLELMGKVAIVAIAKKLEEIYFPDDPFPLHVNKKSESLKVIQQIRNEAHRFAIEFHRNKRSKKITHSELSQIEGIGAKSKERLLKKFKSVKKIRQASLEELALEVGQAKAKVIFNFFNQPN